MSFILEQGAAIIKSCIHLYYGISDLKAAYIQEYLPNTAITPTSISRPSWSPCRDFEIMVSIWDIEPISYHRSPMMVPLYQLST